MNHTGPLQSSSPIADARRMLIEHAKTRETVSQCISCLCFPIGCPTFFICDSFNTTALCVSNICCGCFPKCAKCATQVFQTLNGDLGIQNRADLCWQALLPGPCLDVGLDLLNHCQSGPSPKLARHARLISRYMLPKERAAMHTSPKQQRMSLSIATDALQHRTKKKTEGVAAGEKLFPGTTQE